ncbi:DUF1801 domain-containing protein [Flavobacterium sp. CYK-55]|uniref:iron chaperone n=1 Tax=Flavobacterium sp. CYK-55 TaxID=2835529 RepID=UPI001BCC3A52|nr:DUF1801 domain-containing protein [Flavobacterium sp. CYK-55]MBS7788177.1 DUF1801 domain-containing protein [Flavobacterium sp. CYK-55]
MKPTTVQAYISTFAPAIQSRLLTLRTLVLKIAPEATESISYGMPAYKTLGKPLIYFAGYERHIGLYATPSGHEQFKEALSVYKQGKGSVQFPNNEPLPLGLIEKIILFRVDENQTKYNSRK